MQVILQGSLRHFPLEDLLAFVLQHTSSATVEVEATESRARLCINRRLLVWADSPKERDPRTILRDAASWNAGTFRVFEDVVIPEGATALALELEPLLEELAKIRSESAVFPDTATFLVSDDDRIEQETLQPDELKLLIGMGRGKTFGQLAGSRDRTELSRMIRKLASLGLVAPKAAPPVTIPDETQRQKKKDAFGLSASLTSMGSDGSAHVLIEDEHVIGRDPSCTVAIGDSSVSSQHAKITRGTDGFYIEDLSSRNGTYVNGEKVSDRRLLVDNDVIRFGKVVMAFNVARELARGRTTARGKPTS